MATDPLAEPCDALLLIQFTRSPQEGQVKTRMIPQLSAAQACELHCELTLWTCRQLLASGLGDVELSVAGETDHSLFDCCQDMGAARVSVQVGDDLGQRMLHAIRAGLERYSGVLLVGSDCPGIDVGYLKRAARALQETPLVFGPAVDGGYVLIGARTVTADIFRGIPWGSDEVYGRTKAVLRQEGLPWTELPALTDIDRPEDLPVWRSLKRSAANAASA